MLLLQLHLPEQLHLLGLVVCKNNLRPNTTMRSIKIKIKFVNNQIMNQLSYEVLNLKFKKKGFQFKGGHESSIKETINTLKNSHKY